MKQIDLEANLWWSGVHWSQRGDNKLAEGADILQHHGDNDGDDGDNDGDDGDNGDGDADYVTTARGRRHPAT